MERDKNKMSGFEGKKKKKKVDCKADGIYRTRLVSPADIKEIMRFGR